MAKTIDFVYMAWNCPSDGCPEYNFNHKSEFDNVLVGEIFAKARKTIYAYASIKDFIPESSPLRSEGEISDFAARMQESVPGCEDVLTISSCKAGLISYHKAVRFTDVEDTDDLAKKIKDALPISLQKEKKRYVQSYFMEVE